MGPLYSLLLVAFMAPHLMKCDTTPSQNMTSTVASPTPTMSELQEITTTPQTLLCNRTYTMYTDVERTCIPGLKCKYGKCDRASGFSCICDPGATGLLCELECCLDCGEHGNCFYDSANNEAVCNCDSNHKGDRCDIDIEHETTPVSASPASPTVQGHTTPSNFLLCNATYIMRSDEERTCFPGFQCKYGKCDRGLGFSCICDHGATGALCELECCLDCGDHGNCFYDSANNEAVCNCDSNHKGDRCDIDIEHETTSVSASPASPTVQGQTTPSNFLVCNATYIMRSDDERTCFPGFQCKHGKCDKVSGFRCMCDPGATGFLCNQECCLDCGNHGNCFLDSSSNEAFCNCEFNFKGDRCEEQVESITTSTPNVNCSLDCPDGFVCTVVSIGASTCIPVSTAVSNPTVPPSTLCNKTYELRDITERLCPGGLECQGGYCVAEGETTYCECDEGAHGILCENACCRDCGENGTCFFDALVSEEVCNCYNGFTGDVCDEVITTPTVTAAHEAEDWYLWVVGVSVGALVVLLILLIVLPYILWRHRVILVMKIVHYFQRYEDDDEREWDAFISYKSDPQDEAFVVKVLFPTLERELGFKTHVHFRDFIPGNTIANNIIRAVEGSRRTILVITPNFVKSEFTKFEYQVAQQEMLKHKHRIIPILLDDISEHEETLDPNLKVILGSVTYIKWPGEQTEKKLAKFWKRLQLSLPKKRAMNEAQDELDRNRDSMKIKFPNLVANGKEEDIKHEDVAINVPRDQDEVDIDADVEYEKIDDKQLDKQNERAGDVNANVDKYMEILECTRF